jgi:hypothetical protein
MKLRKLHLFLIIIFVIVASTLGFTVHEYFDNRRPSEIALDSIKSKHTPPKDNAALSKGEKYNPFLNVNEGFDPLLDNDYNKTIAGREDKIVSGRGTGKKQENKERHIAPHKRDAGVDMSKYILKSEIVPPVCPKCPDSRTCPRQKPCPACPSCARCPEPAFECKKVPNYNAMSASSVNNVLPIPKLNSFTQFN